MSKCAFKCASDAQRARKLWKTPRLKNLDKLERQTAPNDADMGRVDWRTHGIFFFHCPKSAGVSLRHRLHQYFEEEAFCPHFEYGVSMYQERKGRYDDCRGHKIYFGHFGRNIYEAVRVRHVPMTSFRDPVDRILSLYKFFRYNVYVEADQLNDPALYMLRAAKLGSLTDFVSSDDPRITVYTRNQHVRQLSHSPWDLDATDALARAQEMLAQMPWYFVMERPEASDAWAKAAIGLDLQDSVRLNPSLADAKDTARLEAEFEPLREMVLAFNQADAALYATALTRLEAASKELIAAA